MGRKIRRNILSALSKVEEKGVVKVKGEFVYHEENCEIVIRDRSHLSSEFRNIEHISFVINEILIMYYRRKVILALLQQFGEEMESNQFQQMLFLFTRQQKKPTYHFVPGKQGAYSFQAQSDKGTMIKYELLKDQEQWVVNIEEDYIKQLKDKDQEILNDLYAQFKNYSFEKQTIESIHTLTFTAKLPRIF